MAIAGARSALPHRASLRSGPTWTSAPARQAPSILPTAARRRTGYRSTREVPQKAEIAAFGDPSSELAADPQWAAGVIDLQDGRPRIDEVRP